MVWTILAAIVTILWAYALSVIFRIRARTFFLRDQMESIDGSSPSTCSDSWPKVRVIAAARNEEHAIEEAVGSWIASDYPNLEIVVVNDRSTDRTPEKLDSLKKRFNRLEIINISELPDGWLGKNHALSRGASDVTSDWFLFTDADIKFHPQAIRKAISFAQKHHLDHLTCTPGFTGGTWTFRGLLVAFVALFLIYFRPDRITDPESSAYVGIGAFNLIKTSVYKKIGGLQKIAMCTDDDMMLGKLIKMHHFRQMLLYGNDMISVTWYRSVRETARGFEKNAFSVLDYNLIRFISWFIAYSIAFFVPYFGIFFSSPIQSIFFGFAIFAQISIFIYIGRLTSSPMTAALSIPLNAITLLYCVTRSVYLAIKRGGVFWKDRFYPIQELRYKGRL